MIDLGLNKDPKETRVVVAMSGGVDSSVTAALLHEAGYQTIGITLQLYDHGQLPLKAKSCCAGQDIYDARRVADTLGIPHYVLDFENRFRESVIDDFVDTYLAGSTPIPCVRCNQTVKFRDLVARAHEIGADALATGHYVRRLMGPGGAELHRAVNDAKDQSYFLFATTREQLDFLRFPLGAMSKDETRAHAERFGLPVADKPDSQDICFVAGGDYADIVRKMRPGAVRPGEIVHLDGRVLGGHNGVIDYTVGQRRGLNIGGGDPLYVIRIDAEAARVVVGPKQALEETRIRLSDINWLDTADAPRNGGTIQVKCRSMQPPVDARIEGDEVVLVEPLAGIAPGQACVFYDGTRVLGGGWITRKTPPILPRRERPEAQFSAG
jgi:tRNA-specific 2-thiouridylase